MLNDSLSAYQVMYRILRGFNLMKKAVVIFRVSTDKMIHGCSDGATRKIQAIIAATTLIGFYDIR